MLIFLCWRVCTYDNVLVLGFRSTSSVWCCVDKYVYKLLSFEIKLCTWYRIFTSRINEDSLQNWRWYVVLIILVTCFQSVPQETRKNLIRQNKFHPVRRPALETTARISSAIDLQERETQEDFDWIKRYKGCHRKSRQSCSPLIENGVKLRRKFWSSSAIGRDQVVNLHFMLSKAQVRQDRVCFGVTRRFGFSTHRKENETDQKAHQKVVRSIRKIVRSFQLWRTSIHTKDTHKILGSTYGMCVSRFWALHRIFVSYDWDSGGRWSWFYC